MIGPNAATVQLGGYSNVPAHVVTRSDGLRAKVGKAGQVEYREGRAASPPATTGGADVALADRATNARPDQARRRGRRACR